jgi:hypothetical protein
MSGRIRTDALAVYFGQRSLTIAGVPLAVGLRAQSSFALTEPEGTMILDVT